MGWGRVVTVRIKVAQNAKELEDVFRLRYEVYVNEEGYFPDMQLSRELIVDRFDAVPAVANIIAYYDGEPVGTLRLNMDSELGLPPEEHYSFQPFRDRVGEEWSRRGCGVPRVGSAGMLAIRKAWRKRRDVIRAMFKTAASVGHAWRATHVVATVNAKTAGMYQRMEFESLDEKQWIEEIGEHIVPMASSLDAFYRWAFRELLVTNKTMLEYFSGRFQRLVIGPNETIFRRGDEAREAFIIDAGTVRISRRIGHDQEQLTLATLGCGALFGELSLVDTKARSADAVTLTDAELIVLDRDDFLDQLQRQPQRMHEILKIFAARLRQADDLAEILAYGSSRQRMRHALDDIRRSAVQDSRDPQIFVAKVSPLEFARNAGVSEEDAREFLVSEVEDKKIEFSERSIRFRTNPNPSEPEAPARAKVSA